MIPKVFRRVRVVEEKKIQRQPLATDKNSKFVYQSGSDVQKTWRKYGWTPPSEYRTDYEFGKHKE